MCTPRQFNIGNTGSHWLKLPDFGAKLGGQPFADFFNRLIDGQHITILFFWQIHRRNINVDPATLNLTGVSC